MRVRVDPEKCQGHTLCAMRASEIFELSDFPDVPDDVKKMEQSFASNKKS